MKTKRLVIVFDLDGVLIDSIPAHYRALKKLFSEFGIKYTFREFVSRDITAGSMNLIPRVMKEHRKSIDLEAALARKNYLMTTKSVPLNSGIKKLLKELKKNNYRMAVASGGTGPFVHDIIRKHRIDRYFGAVVTGDDHVRKKPYPDIYLKAAMKMGVPPRGCVAIDDSHDGIIAAKLAGMKTIGHHNKGHGQDLRIADIVVDSMTKVNIKLIEKLSKE